MADKPLKSKSVEMGKIVLVGCILHANQRRDVRTYRQTAERLQASAQRGHSRLITHVNLIRIILWHHQRTARPADRQLVTLTGIHRPRTCHAAVMNIEIQCQLMARFVIQRRVVTGERTYTVRPDNAFIGDDRWYKVAARFREKDLGMVVKAA